MKSKFKTLWVPTIVVFMSFLIVDGISFFTSINNIDTEARGKANEFVDAAEASIVSRTNVFEETLYAGVGLFSSDTRVTKTDWQQFVNATAISTRYPGARGLGYAPVVAANEAEDFVSSQSSSELPFEIFPSGLRDTYVPVLYLEPQDNVNLRVIGYDMLSEPLIEKAIVRARENGVAQMTEAIDVLQSDSNDKMSGFLMYAPQYNSMANLNQPNERRKAIEGYVYAVFEGDAFFENALKGMGDEHIAYRIYSENGTLFHQSKNYDEVNAASHEAISRSSMINGSALSTEYIYNPHSLVSSSTVMRPWTTLFFGVLWATLVATVTYLILKNRSNQLRLNQERKINEAKDSLLSIASHQLRTPASGVKQYIGLVLQGFAGDISPYQESLLMKANDSNERQLRIINDILYLARIGSGSITLSKTYVDMVQVVDSLLDELEPTIQSNNHKILWTPPKKMQLLYVDEHMIRMAIENLLTNAIKYTQPEGEIRIAVDETEDEVHIRVKDNGVGISEENQALLFQQFSRIPNKLSKSVSGTGIGLFLAKKFVEMHNGTLEVTSSENEGSTFEITLPITRHT